MELLDGLPPIVALALALLLLVWLVLLFLLPFMVENIRSWTRRIHGELEDLNDKLDRLNRLLGDQAGYRSEPPRERPGERGERAEPQAPRTRREPTISDLPPIEPARRPPPAVRR